MTNAGTRRTPLLLAEERLNLALGDRPRFLARPARPGEVRQVEYAVRSHLRGRHPLGPLTVVLRDPFGLTNRFAEVGATGDIVVLPRIDPLVGGRPPGNGVGAEGEIPFMVALHGEDDQSIREYRDGDDLRRIHWPATARTGDLMVRQEDRPARRRAMILLDPRAGAHQGHGASSSFEWAVSAAASVVTHLAGLGYATHLICSETVHDGQAAMTTDADHALDVLAEAETGPRRRARPSWSGPRTRSPPPEAWSSRSSPPATRSRCVRSRSLRQPGGSGLAIVLDTATFADSPRGAHASSGRGGGGEGSTGGPVGERLRRAAPYRGLVGRGGPAGRRRPRGVVRTDHARGAGRMISRAVDALSAAAATIAAVLGLTTLTENGTWLGRAIWACLVVAAVGVLLRRLTSFRLLVLFGQLVVTALGGHRDVRGRPALVRPAGTGRLEPGGRAGHRLRGRDAALCRADPCHRRGASSSSSPRSPDSRSSSTSSR